MSPKAGGSSTSFSLLERAALGGGRGICLSGLVCGSPPTPSIITVAFYFLLFVTPFGLILRAGEVDDLWEHVVVKGS